MFNILIDHRNRSLLQNFWVECPRTAILKHYFTDTTFWINHTVNHMNPFSLLILIFLTIPIVEMYLLIKVGSVIGAPLTIFLVVFTAVLGAWLLRWQGFATIRRIQETISQGGLPAAELLEGAVLLIAGALLLTPGFFTDTIGFLCLIPPLRHAMVLYAMRRFISSKSSDVYEFHVEQRESRSPRGTSSTHRNQTIEGDYTREED